ncbi:amphi-Trp domain-containing protein [Natranaerofaba carboxydovora]|uniref:amphi-Trp domain-containing protein n=1 Tax=Natranaerofaba carboxydovora TaxID=2742683 RepID=UPI001F12BBB1|nr:amphi-Trp domain-containing protein [Natranaerofaba carboxydovora]UMZ73591.1 amphi-Trp: amphi-Trp domain protein [Natranaerofaba carboxydovora]
MSSNSTVHFYSEEPKSTKDIGEFLKMIGEKLSNEGSFSLQQGETEHNIAPSGATKLELKYKTKQDKHEFEIEIEWKPGSDDVIIK